MLVAGLFSATQTEAVEALARAGLRNPVRVKVDNAPTTQVPTIPVKLHSAAAAAQPASGLHSCIAELCTYSAMSSSVSAAGCIVQRC